MPALFVDQSLSIDTHQIEKAALVYRAINHPLRRQLLHLLHKNARMNVTDIYTKMQLEQSVASQHLAILRKPGIVSTKRDGKNVFYSINYSRLHEVNAIAKKIADY